MIPGFWTPDYDADLTWKIQSDGHFQSARPNDVDIWEGSWGVTNRCLVTVTTNRDWPNSEIRTNYYGVLQIDDRKWVFYSGDIICTAHKKLMPKTTLEPALTTHPVLTNK